MSSQEEDSQCYMCDGEGYYYEGCYSINEEYNIKVPCTECKNKDKSELEDN